MSESPRWKGFPGVFDLCSKNITRTKVVVAVNVYKASSAQRTRCRILKDVELSLVKNIIIKALLSNSTPLPVGPCSQLSTKHLHCRGHENDMDNTKYLEGSSAQDHASLLNGQTGLREQDIGNGHSFTEFDFENWPHIGEMGEQDPAPFTFSPTMFASQDNKTPSQFLDIPDANVAPEPTIPTHPPLSGTHANNQLLATSSSFTPDPIPTANRNALATSFAQNPTQPLGYNSLGIATVATSSTPRLSHPARSSPQTTSFNGLKATRTAHSSPRPSHPALQLLGYNTLGSNSVAASAAQKPSHLPRLPPQNTGYNGLEPNPIATSHAASGMPLPYNGQAVSQYQHQLLMDLLSQFYKQNHNPTPMPGQLCYPPMMASQVGNCLGHTMPPGQPVPSGQLMPLGQPMPLGQHMPFYGMPNQHFPDPNQQSLSKPRRRQSPICSRKARTKVPQSDTDPEEDEGAGEKIVSSVRGGRTHPSGVYRPFKQVFPYSLNWGSRDLQFTYTDEGVWSPRKRFSTEQLAFYIDNCPRKLVIWVQNHPAQSCDRTDRWDRTCRWEECPSNQDKPANQGLIHSGWRRVAFDEFSELTKNGEKDPFKSAGVMHLYCLEQCFDVFELHSKKILRPDIRKFPREDRSPFSLEREPSAGAVVAAYHPWMARIKERVKTTGSAGVIPRPHEESLSYALNEHHLSRQGGTRQHTRMLRNENKRKDEIKTVDYHKGDLLKFTGAQQNQVKRKREEIARKKDEKIKKIKMEHQAIDLTSGNASRSASVNKDGNVTSSQCANPQLHSTQEGANQPNQEIRGNTPSPIANINPLSTTVRQRPGETEAADPASWTPTALQSPAMDHVRVTAPAGEKPKSHILDQAIVVLEPELEPGLEPSSFESLFGSPEPLLTPIMHHMHHNPASSSSFQAALGS